MNEVYVCTWEADGLFGVIGVAAGIEAARALAEAWACLAHGLTALPAWRFNGAVYSLRVSESLYEIALYPVRA